MFLMLIKKVNKGRHMDVERNADSITGSQDKVHSEALLCNTIINNGTGDDFLVWGSQK